jgi:hypothetical protein
MRDPFIPLERQIGKRLPDKLVWQLRYLLHHRRWPNLDQPRDFNEKVIWRTLYDRRPIFVTAADKHASKQMALERCPWIRVPETIWKGKDVAELVGLDLPERWVLKPNNSTHRVIFGAGQVSAERAKEFAIETEGWADTPYQPNARAGTRRYWCEAAAENCLLVEEFIGGGSEPPSDIKFFVFHGRVEVILICPDRYSNPHRAYLDRNWKILPVRDNKQQIGEVELPEMKAKLFEAAEAISGDLDFGRVDLYEAGGAIWFGELTLYSGSGLTRLLPHRFDREWGEFWTLPSLEEVAGA